MVKVLAACAGVYVAAVAFGTVVFAVHTGSWVDGFFNAVGWALAPVIVGLGYAAGSATND